MKTRICSCGKPCSKAWHLACSTCWAMVPTTLQSEVYHLFKTARGTGEHLACIKECYKAISAAGGGLSSRPRGVTSTITVDEVAYWKDSAPRSATKKPKGSILVKVRMGSGSTWCARTKSPPPHPPSAPVTASCTAGAERAARRAAAKAFRCEEGDVSLAVNEPPLWNKPGSYFAIRCTADLADA